MMDSLQPDYPAESTPQIQSSSAAGLLIEQLSETEKLAERTANGRALLLRMRSLDREAFRPDLFKALVGAPSIEEIRAYAAKMPDRWAMMLATLARLSGYTERPDDNSASTNPMRDIATLSDGELMDRLASMDDKLGQLVNNRKAPPAMVTDAEFRSVSALDSLLED